MVFQMADVVRHDIAHGRQLVRLSSDWLEKSLASPWPPERPFPGFPAIINAQV